MYNVFIHVCCVYAAIICTMYSYMYVVCMQRSYGGLKDEDRIFTNLYGRHDWRLKGAQARVGRGAGGGGGGGGAEREKEREGVKRERICVYMYVCIYTYILAGRALCL